MIADSERWVRREARGGGQGWRREGWENGPEIDGDLAQWRRRRREEAAVELLTLRESTRPLGSAHPRDRSLFFLQPQRRGRER